MEDTFQRFSPARIWALAMSTVTQLIRMRIIGFLAVFGLVVVGVGFMFSAIDPEQQLKQLKDWSFGLLFFFATMMAIVSTALLLPRDVEDRTLYTILAKPVPRLDYLLGKLLGVLIVIGAGLLIMDVLFCIVLYTRERLVIANELAVLQHQFHGKATPEMMSSTVQAIERQGLNWNLQWGVWSIFLKASVLASLALLVSCFASSTLFTVVTTACLAVLGLGEGMLRDYFLRGGVAFWKKSASIVLAVLVPDLSAFDASDAVSAGRQLLLEDGMNMTGLAALYVVGYTTVAYLIFVEKEL